MILPVPLGAGGTGLSANKEFDRMDIPPRPYRSPLAKFEPDTGPDPERLKRDGWRQQKILVVSADDERLDWMEREILRQIGDRLYGPGGARHG